MKTTRPNSLDRHCSPQVVTRMSEDWRTRSACAGRAALMSDPAREAAAIALCMNGCPVRADCAASLVGITEEEDHGGVIAGWSERSRSKARQVAAGYASHLAREAS